MNLTPLQNTPTMSSREIAELCGKEHRNVCRDIDNLNETYEKIPLPNFGQGYYTTPTTGNQQHRDIEAKYKSAGISHTISSRMTIQTSAGKCEAKYKSAGLKVTTSSRTLIQTAGGKQQSVIITDD